MQYTKLFDNESIHSQTRKLGIVGYGRAREATAKYMGICAADISVPIIRRFRNKLSGLRIYAAEFDTLATGRVKNGFVDGDAYPGGLFAETYRFAEIMPGVIVLGHILVLQFTLIRHSGRLVYHVEKTIRHQRISIERSRISS